MSDAGTLSNGCQVFDFDAYILVIRRRANRSRRMDTTRVLACR